MAGWFAWMAPAPKTFWHLLGRRSLRHGGDKLFPHHDVAVFFCIDHFWQCSLPPHSTAGRYQSKFGAPLAISGNGAPDFSPNASRKSVSKSLLAAESAICLGRPIRKKKEPGQASNRWAEPNDSGRSIRHCYTGSGRSSST